MWINRGWRVGLETRSPLSLARRMTSMSGRAFQHRNHDPSSSPSSVPDSEPERVETWRSMVEARRKRKYAASSGEIGSGNGSGASSSTLVNNITVIDVDADRPLLTRSNDDAEVEVVEKYSKVQPKDNEVCVIEPTNAPTTSRKAAKRPMTVATGPTPPYPTNVVAFKQLESCVVCKTKWDEKTRIKTRWVSV